MPGWHLVRLPAQAATPDQAVTGAPKPRRAAGQHRVAVESPRVLLYRRKVALAVLLCVTAATLAGSAMIILVGPGTIAVVMIVATVALVTSPVWGPAFRRRRGR